MLLLKKNALDRSKLPARGLGGELPPDLSVKDDVYVHLIVRRRKRGKAISIELHLVRDGDSVTIKFPAVLGHSHLGWKISPWLLLKHLRKLKLAFAEEDLLEFVVSEQVNRLSRTGPLGKSAIITLSFVYENNRSWGFRKIQARVTRRWWESRLRKFFKDPKE